MRSPGSCSIVEGHHILGVPGEPGYCQAGNSLQGTDYLAAAELRAPD